VRRINECGHPTRDQLDAERLLGDAARDPDHQPTHLGDVLCTLNFIGEAGSVQPMMIPVVFHSEHQVLPTHIQVVLAIPVSANHRNLSPRARISGANQQEPQRCFPR
jgi:hypothetical protein